MSQRRKIAATAVPPGTGTYTPAIRAGDFLFLTGQTGFSHETGKLAEDLAGQTRTMLENVDKLLSASGCSREGIVQVKLILTDLADFKAVDQMYADLTGAGYRAQQPPYDAIWGARYAVVEDPDGNPVGLMSEADPALAQP